MLDKCCWGSVLNNNRTIGKPADGDKIKCDNTVCGAILVYQEPRWEATKYRPGSWSKVTSAK